MTYTQKVCIIYRVRRFINMKQRDLIKLFKKAGFEFERHGAEHDVYRRGDDQEEIPRHREINEILAKKLIKRWGL